MLRKLIVCCTNCTIALTISSVLSLYAPTATAEAPVNAFLAELKDRRLFDVAIRHIERMATSPLTSADFKQEVDYIRGAMLVDAARASKGTNAAQQQLNQAEAAFTKFLRDHTNHPSASLARSQLGNILVERARQQLAAAEKDKTNQAELLKQAGQTYAKAYKSLTQSRTEIGKQIKSLTAQRDGDTKRLISELRTKYVQTYLAVARVLFEQAKTVKSNPTKYKTKLEAAAKEFGEVVDKYRAYSASILALRYQGECYQLMGEHKQALSYYKELLQSADNSPPVRRLKTQALAKSIDSLLITERNSGPDRAIGQATGWIKKKRPGEDKDATWQELQLALARAYKQKADITEDDTQSARTIREARDLANQVAKRRGPHQTDAQRLLVSLGANTTTKEAAIVDGFKAANFAEARDAAMSSLDALKRANVTVKILSDQLGTVAAVGRRAAIEEKLAEAKEQSETLSTATLERFEQADALATKDDLDAQNGVRYYLAFLNYSVKRYRRAAVIGSYVALRFPDSVAAKECANVALAARQRLYQQSDPESREAQGQQIAKLAELMVSRWPNQAAGDSALMTLLGVVVSRGDLQGAQTYLEKIPADSPKRAKAELRIGQAIWRKYLTRVASGDTTTDTKELSTKAQQILANGIGRLGSDARDESTVRAALSLAQIYVDSGNPKLALDLLMRDGFGALKLIESNSAILKRIPALSTEAYKTAIRAHVATAATSGDTAGSIRSAQKMLEALQNELKKQPNGKQKIVAIYISLAKDLERQLKIAAPSDRKALSRGFESFLRGASNGNKDIAVQNWAGATFFSLGQGMLQGNKTSPEAQRYFTESAKAYEQVLMMAKGQPKAMSANALMQVRARQAMALRQLGDYSKSIDLFADVLGSQKKSYLNIQIEAAKTFQQWGVTGGNSKALTKAINGDKPRGDGRNIIWGWGRIAKLVAKNEQYRDTFHEARYNVALCRYRLGLSLSGSQKTQTLKRAKSDITITKQLYGLGKKSQERRYEDLLKKIQRALNENPVGFGEPENT